MDSHRPMPTGLLLPSVPWAHPQLTPALGMERHCVAIVLVTRPTRVQARDSASPLGCELLEGRELLGSPPSPW